MPTLVLFAYSLVTQHEFLRHLSPKDVCIVTPRLQPGEEGLHKHTSENQKHENGLLCSLEIGARLLSVYVSDSGLPGEIKHLISKAFYGCHFLEWV